MRLFSRMFPIAATLLTCSNAIAQDGGEANLQTGASYSSLRGSLGFLTFNAYDLLGSGLDFRLGYQGGKDGYTLDANIAKTVPLDSTALGYDTFLRTTINARSSDWTSQSYSLESYGANITLGARSLNGLRYSGRFFWKVDSLGDFDDDVSPLVAATPLKDSTTIGLGLNLSYSTFVDRGPMATGLLLKSSLAIATPAGDREWSSAEVGLQYNAALPMGLVVAIKGDAGQISGRNGDDVKIVDRAFIGNPMPRGFGSSGIGPRDFIEDGVNTPLGGNRFLTSSLELRAATLNPNIMVGIFADAGALWELDQTEGGASGVIDDSYYLRTSVGLSVYWDTSVGLMQLNIAKPLDKLDLDEEDRISLNINFLF